jgi:uncharacterized protein YprB with RNaseH-like and TPR domain
LGVVVMGTRLRHIPFDIETSGFALDAQVTVIGVALPLGCRVLLNTAGRSASASSLETRLTGRFDEEIQLTIHEDEANLLDAFASFLEETVAAREYLLVAYNGERFNGGFDLPFLRTRYAKHQQDWPFDGIPYADLVPLIRNRFNTTTGDDAQNDLVDAYESLIGGPYTDEDPFADSSKAVPAFESAEFEALLAHNIADVLRTKALASLAKKYCGKSDFSLKSLTPVCRDPALSALDE